VFAAILFDVDGTLLDSAEFVLGAVEHTLRIHGRVPPLRQQIAATMGPPLVDCYRVLAPGLDPVTLVAAHRAWQRGRMHLVRPFPNTIATLQALRAQSLRCGAVTARSRVSSLGTLEGAGLAGLLEVVVSAEDTPRTKPYPDPVLAALRQLGVAPAAAALVGDTATDIEAGRAAGVTTIGALYGFFGESLRDHRPDRVIRDIADVLALLN
jgi:HAD superfamily hydrolase (TIGR01509 family)